MENKNIHDGPPRLRTRLPVNITKAHVLSHENRERLRRLIEIIQNQIELEAGKISYRMFTISKDILHRERYSDDEFKSFIKIINEISDLPFIEIVSSDEVHRVAWELYPDSIVEIPDNHLLIQYSSPQTLGMIKGEIDKFEKEQLQKNHNDENTKKEKNGKTIKLLGGYLTYLENKIPMKGGQKIMMKLFLDKAEISNRSKIRQKGEPLRVEVLTKECKYRDENSFRNALKKMRVKLRDNNYPATIDNVGDKEYQLSIKYD